MTDAGTDAYALFLGLAAMGFLIVLIQMARIYPWRQSRISALAYVVLGLIVCSLIALGMQLCADSRLLQ